MRIKILTWLAARYANVGGHHRLSFFGRLLDDPYLFHLNHRSVPGAFAVGLFCTWIPMPLQMIIAATFAIVLRVNLPLSVLLVWISNPLTIPPMFYFAYWLGARILGDATEPVEFQLSFQWIVNELSGIGEPLFVGCAVLGVSSSLVGYSLMRIVWNERLARLLHLKIERHKRKQPPRSGGV